jgi:hypothetical protein
VSARGGNRVLVWSDLHHESANVCSEVVLYQSQVNPSSAQLSERATSPAGCTPLFTFEAEDILRIWPSRIDYRLSNKFTATRSGGWDRTSQLFTTPSEDVELFDPIMSMILWTSGVSMRTIIFCVICLTFGVLHSIYVLLTNWSIRFVLFYLDRFVNIHSFTHAKFTFLCVPGTRKVFQIYCSFSLTGR